MTQIRSLLLATSFIFAACQAPPEEEETVRPVKAIQVEDPQLILSRPFPGIARAENRVNLSFRVDGPLVELPIDVGDTVKRGQIIARIDPRDYQISLQAAEAEQAKTQAALTFAESDFARAERIQKQDPGAISESKVDEKREERNRLIAELQGSQSKVEAAKDQLSYTKLTAPFEGIIVAKYFDNFEYVRARQAVARILDTSRIEMVVDVPGSMIPYAEIIRNIEVSFGAFPDLKLKAEIKEIGEEASTTTRTFPVTLIMKQPEGVRILAGMSGEARFVGKIDADSPLASIIIPASAVLSPEEGGPTYVWVVDDESKTVSKREVKLNNLTSKGIQVSKGLSPGEWIAVAGIHFLQEGQKVTILGSDEQVEQHETGR